MSTKVLALNKLRELRHRDTERDSLGTAHRVTVSHRVDRCGRCRQLENEGIRTIYCSACGYHLPLEGPPPPRSPALALIDEIHTLGLRVEIRGDQACIDGEVSFSIEQRLESLLEEVIRLLTRVPPQRSKPGSWVG